MKLHLLYKSLYLSINYRSSVKVRGNSHLVRENFSSSKILNSSTKLSSRKVGVARGSGNCEIFKYGAGMLGMSAPEERSIQSNVRQRLFLGAWKMPRRGGRRNARSMIPDDRGTRWLDSAVAGMFLANAQHLRAPIRFGIHAGECSRQ